jgi:hypothetical protein
MKLLLIPLGNSYESEVGSIDRWEQTVDYIPEFTLSLLKSKNKMWEMFLSGPR